MWNIEVLMWKREDLHMSINAFNEIRCVPSNKMETIFSEILYSSKLPKQEKTTWIYCMH